MACLGPAPARVARPRSDSRCCRGEWGPCLDRAPAGVTGPALFLVWSLFVKIFLCFYTYLTLSFSVLGFWEPVAWDHVLPCFVAIFSNLGPHFPDLVSLQPSLECPPLSCEGPMPPEAAPPTVFLLAALTSAGTPLYPAG